ncbi:AAA family ATPase [Vibrio fluvialis]|uniref:AAA family ATPase n=1 Tax=Vibrio fluvialis TaxID=676 RepID=UPI00193BA5B6|nr:AAA family ATPase [Vibrio fluvialis]
MRTLNDSRYRYYVRITSSYGLRDGSYKFSGVFVRREAYDNKIPTASNAVVEIPESVNAEPCVGQVWEIKGSSSSSVISTNNNYEITQFKFVNPEVAMMVMPESLEEFYKFIGSNNQFEGIGETTARRLGERFGISLLSMMKSGEIQPIAEFLTHKKAESFLKGFRKYENIQFAIEFAKLGIPQLVQQKLFKLYKKDAFEQLKSNPYLLQTFGLSLEQVDGIAINSFGIDEYDRRRLNALVEYAMNMHCRNGHTVIESDFLWDYIFEYTNDEDIAEEAIRSASSSLGVYYNLDSGLVHHTGLYVMESVIAKRIKRLLGLSKARLNGSDDSYQHVIKNLSFQLNEKQDNALNQSLNNRVFVLTGGAGTGKTTLLQAVVDTYLRLDVKVFGLALSGRAAKRLQESINISTYTIQRFLMLNDLDISANDSILLLIDEASMIDVPSLYKIVMKLPRDRDVRLIFVGDEEQLAPIGSGLVLSELIDSGVVPRVHLTEVRRQSSTTGIPCYANEIRNGRIPKHFSYKNISFEECSRRDVVGRTVDLYMESGRKAQILVPTRVLADEINSLCQAVSNPYGRRLMIRGINGDDDDLGIRIGDPVIFTKNDYRADVQNGTLGTVISLYDREDKSVLAKVKIDTGETVSVTYSMIDNLELAYAITLHKAQGSQFETVISPIVHSRIIDKSWVYTAITRATTNMFWLGSEQILRNSIISKTKAAQRQVYLSNLLQKEYL